MMPRVPFSIILTAVLLSFGCSIDYEAALSDEGIEENIPNTVIEGLRFVSVRQGTPVIEMEADKALAYNKKKETHLQGVTFYEYTRDGEIASTGSGDFGIYYQDTENVDMEGSLDLYSKQEEARITAKALSWNKENRSLKGSSEDIVRIEKDDGSFFQGKDFLGKIGEKTFEFGAETSGTFEVPEEENEEE